MKKTIIYITVFLFIIVLITILFPIINSNYIKTGKLYISEILASNSSVLKDNNGDYSDYIEIHNGYNVSINLKDYHLSDSEYDTKKWTFPEIEIKPHENLIVYASGKDECIIEDRICHTNFKLNSKGETITLTDSGGNIISKFSFSEQFNDISYGYKKGKYIYFETPTPGEDNNSNEYKTVSSKKYNLKITEYMTHNKRFNSDIYGNYYDWVEIQNLEGKEINLETLYITDDPSNLKKYKIPKTNIKSKQYFIIYLAGQKVSYDDGIYANFSISDDEYIIISNGKDTIDKVKIVNLLDNISYGIKDGEWLYFTSPTPGEENITAGFTSIGGLNGSS